jgi:hypothetical protein
MRIHQSSRGCIRKRWERFTFSGEKAGRAANHHYSAFCAATALFKRAPICLKLLIEFEGFNESDSDPLPH